MPTWDSQALHLYFVNLRSASSQILVQASDLNDIVMELNNNFTRANYANLYINKEKVEKRDDLVVWEIAWS